MVINIDRGLVGMNKYSLMKAVVLGLILMNVSMVSAKSLHNQDTKCSSTAYISTKRDVPLLEKPNNDGLKVVMNLHSGQFLCVVNPQPIEVSLGGRGVTTYWVLVRKVPTNELEDKEAKRLVHDYPESWLVPKPKGGACLIKKDYNPDVDYVYTKGVCATGYIRTSMLRLFNTDFKVEYAH